MKYVKVVEGVGTEYTLEQLRLDNKRVSFPSNISDAVLADYDVYPLTVESKPDYDPYTQSLVADAPALVSGSWVQGWTVSSTAEIAVAEVTMSQARRALLAAGHLDSVDPAIAAITDESARKQAEIQWEYSTSVRRESSLVNTLGAALGLTSAEIDALFVAAAKLD